MQIDQRPKPGVDEDETRPPLLSVPAAMAVLLTFTLVVLAGIYLYGRAIRPSEVAPVPTALSAPAVPTPQAVPTIPVAPTPVIATTPTPVPTAVPTLVATPIPAAAPISAESVPATTQEPAAPSEPTPFPTAPLPGPTVPPELAQEVGAAYRQYWEVTAEAFSTNDESRLNEVAIDPLLSFLKNAIDANQRAGRTILINVEHHAVVYFVQDDEAAVVDVYRDSSIYIDPTTHEPLPGQAAPATPSDAPEVKRVWRLRNVEGTWKAWASQGIS